MGNILKPGLCVRLVRLVMLSPDPQQYRGCQAGEAAIGTSEDHEPPLERRPPPRVDFGSLFLKFA